MQNSYEKITNILKKLNTPLAYAIILAIAGAILIIFPESVLSIFFIIAGAIVLAFSVSRLAIDAGENKAGLGYVFKIVTDSLFVALGLALIFWRTALLSMLCRTIGIAMTFWSIYKLYRLSKVEDRSKNRWALKLAATIILLVVGIALLAYPIYPDIMVGIALIVIAARLLIDTKRKSDTNADNAEDGVYYTDDFVDKSDT